VERGQIQAKAFKVWKGLGHPNPLDVSLEDLAMSRGLLVLDGDLKQADGRLLRKNGRGIARIRRDISQPRRRRFTIAHELGHWELHQDQTQLLCSAEDIRDYGRSPLEMEANHFAAELLMPPQPFREAIGKAEPSMKLIKNLVNEFGTTLTATAIRFADLSSHRFIVVWSVSGKILWAYRDEKTTSLFVKSGVQLPRYCSATLDEAELSSDMDHYDQANWFPQLSREVGEVMEVSLRMKNLRAALTLLWLPR